MSVTERPSVLLGRLRLPESHDCILTLPRDVNRDAIAGDVRRCSCGAVWVFGFNGKTYLAWHRLSSYRAWQARRLLRKQAEATDLSDQQGQS